jgi:hypothetical protein
MRRCTSFRCQRFPDFSLTYRLFGRHAAGICSFCFGARSWEYDAGHCSRRQHTCALVVKSLHPSHLASCSQPRFIRLARYTHFCRSGLQYNRFSVLACKHRSPRPRVPSNVCTPRPSSTPSCRFHEHLTKPPLINPFVPLSRTPYKTL